MFVFRIKEIRENKNITLYRLSKKTGISRSYLTDLENNKKTNPSLETAYKISLALDVGIRDLFYSTLDIEKLKKEMYKKIDKYGLNSKEVAEISQLIDLLINIEMKEKKLKKTFSRSFSFYFFQLTPSFLHHLMYLFPIFLNIHRMSSKHHVI